MMGLEHTRNDRHDEIPSRIDSVRLQHSVGLSHQSFGQWKGDVGRFRLRQMDAQGIELSGHIACLVAFFIGIRHIVREQLSSSIRVESNPDSRSRQKGKNGTDLSKGLQIEHDIESTSAKAIHVPVHRMKFVHHDKIIQKRKVLECRPVLSYAHDRDAAIRECPAQGLQKRNAHQTVTQAAGPNHEKAFLPGHVDLAIANPLLEKPRVEHHTEKKEVKDRLIEQYEEITTHRSRPEPFPVPFLAA